MSKKRRFNCPVCTRECIARKDPDHPDRFKLAHPLPLCDGFSTGLLAKAYLLKFNPPTRFPPMHDIAEEVYKKRSE